MRRPLTSASVATNGAEALAGSKPTRRRHIEQALAEAETLEEAAARLGINPTTLWRKRYGIE